jgi:hypothetical protein
LVMLLYCDCYGQGLVSPLSLYIGNFSNLFVLS